MVLSDFYKINDKGNDYVVGDLHGCFDLLEEKLHEIGFDKKTDRLFSVGDLVDRGKKNLECLRLLAEPWFHAVQGNHEDMMIDAVLRRVNVEHWYVSGGDWYIKLSQEEKKEVEQICQIIRSTVPYSITVKTRHGDTGICHAQPPSENWKDAVYPNERAVQVMLWGRTWIDSGDTDPVKSVSRTFHGHTKRPTVISLGATHFIDTGAVHTGNLTIIQIN